MVNINPLLKFYDIHIHEAILMKIETCFSSKIYNKNDLPGSKV